MAVATALAQRVERWSAFLMEERLEPRFERQRGQRVHV